jgi:hypothetical protein
MTINKISLFLAVSIACGGAGAQAEIIKSPAGLRLKAEGRTAILLKKDTKAECVDSQAAWRTTGIEAYVPLEALDSRRGGLMKGALLYDKDGRIFGKAEEAVPEVLSFGKADRKTGRVLVGLVMLGSPKDVRPESIVERELAGRLKGGAKTRTAGALAAHLNKFQYKKWFGYGDVKSFGVYENWMEDPSAGFRTVLIFKGEKLAAVMHSRKVDYKFLSSKAFPRGMQFSWVEALTGPEAERLERYYLDILKAAD